MECQTVLLRNITDRQNRRQNRSTEIARVEDAGVRSMECQTVLLVNDMFNTTKESDDARRIKYNDCSE